MKCSRCGSELFEGQKFCVRCGALIEPSSDNNCATDRIVDGNKKEGFKPVDYKSNRKRRNIPFMVLGIATIVLFVFVFINYKRSVPSHVEIDDQSYAESQTDVDNNNLGEDTSSFESDEEEIEQQTEMSPAAFYFVGKPLSALFQAFGEDYESYNDEGGVFLYYSDIGVSFGFPWNEELNEDTIVTTIVVYEGDYPLYATLNASMTYPEIKDCLDAEGTHVPEPEEYHNELDNRDYYFTTANSTPGRIKLNFEWEGDPYTTNVSRVIIIQGV